MKRVSAVRTDFPGRSAVSGGELSARVIGVGATAVWVWTCLCVYPSHDWNAIRLTPSFLFHPGATPYPGPGEGPVTTWVYGPIPLLLQFPATWAGSLVGALMTAGVINLLIALLPLWIALRACLGPEERPRVLLWAGLIATAAWPATQFIFTQADNSAVAFCLLAGVALLPAGPGGARLWWAAGAFALAVWSKQTEIGPPLGALLYLFVRHGWRSAALLLVRCVAAGALLGVVLLPLCGAEGLFYNMFVVPGGFPWVELLPKAIHPIYRGYVLLQVVLPALILLVAARQIFRRENPALLWALMFACSLPFNVAGFATIGGNINSLHGCLYLLPAGAVWLTRRGLRAGGGRFAVPALLLGAILVAQVGTHRPRPLQPDVLALRQARNLAAQLPGQIYFPWNPIATYYADKRIDHTEDGLLTRRVAGRPLSDAQIRRHLPPQLSVIAFHRFVNDGIVKALVPPGARQDQFGEWVLYSWDPASLAK